MILPLPTYRADRLTLHVLAAAGGHERHVIGESIKLALAVCVIDEIARMRHPVTSPVYETAGGD